MQVSLVFGGKSTRYEDLAVLVAPNLKETIMDLKVTYDPELTLFYAAFVDGDGLMLGPQGIAATLAGACLRLGYKYGRHPEWFSQPFTDDFNDKGVH
jgi:hypothetical protein